MQREELFPHPFLMLVPQSATKTSGNEAEKFEMG